MKTDLLLTPEDVQEIVALLDGCAYSELDLRTTRFRLRMRREGTGWTQEWSWQDDATPASAAAAPTPGTPATAVVPEGLIAVKAPLPGTFYRSPQPGAPAFVSEGDLVEPDTTVGIIETMKLMNQVSAGCRGRVRSVEVVDGTLVEGQALLVLVEPVDRP